MDHSLPGSSIHGIFQARVLEWGAIAFSGVELHTLIVCIHAIAVKLLLHELLIHEWHGLWRQQRENISYLVLYRSLLNSDPVTV